MRFDDPQLNRALAGMAPGYDELLADLRDALRRDGRAGAMFVIGSAARGQTDRYSDLDVLLVARAAEAEVLAEGLVAVLGQLAPVVMARWTKPGILATVLADWRRLDVVVIDAAAMRGRRPGPALRVFDDIGIGEIPERVHVRCPERLREHIELFLRSLGLLPRDLRRGDLRLCCLAVEFLVDELVTLMFDEIGRPRGPMKGTVSRLPRESLEALERIPVAQPETRSLIDAHLAVARIFLPRARALATEWDVVWPAELEEATRRYLDRELDIELP